MSSLRRWGLRSRWVVASALGGAAYGMLNSGVRAEKQYFLIPLLVPVVLPTAASYLLILLYLPAVGPQWLVIWQYTGHLGWWVLATVAGILVGPMAGILVGTFVHDLAHSIEGGRLLDLTSVSEVAAHGGLGITLGAFQGLVLAMGHPRPWRAGWWVLANVMGWVAFAWVMWSVTGGTLFGSGRAPAGGILAGTAYGVITGFALVRLLAGRPERSGR